MRKALLHHIASHIVEKCVGLSSYFKSPSGTSQDDVSEGTVLKYSMEIFSLVLVIPDF